MSTTYVLTMTITVHDEALLMADACSITWEDSDRVVSPESALMWLIDPGVSPEGCTIEETTCTTK